VYRLLHKIFYLRSIPFGPRARSNEVAFFFIIRLVFLRVSPEQEHNSFVFISHSFRRAFGRYSRGIDVSYWENQLLGPVEER
jgi:hypothetical protein